ncbi:MAG: histidine phosphatase family protein [Actinobacteria bacterium]|nr:histidine phosphatase family protein [Actinomycetota bacterium]
MPRLYLVRHGKPSVGWGESGAPDPGLDYTGRAQAEATAAALASLGPLPVLVSPLRRTRETAAPLGAHWALAPVVEAAVGELRAPAGVADHGSWLHEVMSSTYPTLGPDLAAFRDRVVGRLRMCAVDTVVVTHFIAINAAAGAATADERVVSFAPDHCSVTVLDLVDGRLELVVRGGEAATVVQAG